jgi:Amt family ammonium transporter
MGITDSQSGLPAAVAVFLITLALAIAPLAPAGLALMNAGLTRTRSAAHCLFLSLASASAAMVAFIVLGLVVFLGRSSGNLIIPVLGKSFDVLGNGPLVAHGIDPNAAALWGGILFASIGAGFAAIIAVGTGAERWRTSAGVISATILGAWTFPLFAHWVWAGWLARFGVVDAAGSSCIQALGGLNALAVAWIAGPRRTKFNHAGVPTATPGHNAPFILFGCMLAAAGWVGLNIAGSVLFGSAGLARAPFVALGTLLSGATGALAAGGVTRIRFGKPDASLSANGFIAGLVASSAGCALVPPAGALLIGLVAGGMAVYCIEILELRLKIDDPAGAISVHAAAGMWGLLAAGVFAGTDHLVAQLVLIATLLGAMFPMMYGIQRAVKAFVPFRVVQESERQGMDLSELGAGAYPEFMIHRDDLGPR